MDIRDLMQLFNNVMDRFFNLFYCIITKSPGELFQGIFFLCRKKSDTAAQKLCLVFLWNIQFIRGFDPCVMESSKNGTADHTVFDHMTDAELTQLIIDLGGMFCEVKTDPTLFQACRDGIQTVCCCDINAVDSTGIYDHYPGVFLDAVFNIFLKNLYICKKQVFAETVDHNALNRVGETVSGQIKISISSRDHTTEGARRVGGLQDHSYEREQDTNDNPINGSKTEHTESGSYEDVEFCTAYFEKTYSQMGFHHIHQSRDHYGCQYRNRKISDKTGAEKKDQSHGDPGSDGNRLRFSTVLFIEGGAGDTAVYWAAAYCGGSNISGGTGQDFLTVVQLIIIAERKGILCKKSFCHNDNSNHKTAACRLGQINISEIRDHQGGKPTFYRLQEDYAFFVHMKNNGGKNTQSHNNDSHGKFRRQLFKCADQHQSTKPHEEGKPADIFGSSEDMLCQFQELSGSCRTSHKFRDLHQDDGNCDTADKTAHNRCGDKVHDLICVKQKEDKQPQTCKKCDGRNIIHGNF